MKIAITADLHLRQDRSERINALANLLERISVDGISMLIISGDLFDREDQNYGYFDEFIKEYKEVEIIIIPGNHDPSLQQRHFITKNIRVITEPEIIRLKDVHFVLVPFRFGLSMDEALAEFFDTTSVPDRWVLLAHGDYITGTRTPNPYEPGIYMPLSSQAIEKYKPEKVILGHIHRPLYRGELGRVYYPGSLCGLDINETGPRGFIVLELPQLQVQWQRLPTDVIYFIEKLLIFPEDDEEAIAKRVQRIIESWPIEKDERAKVSLRLHLTGYCWDKRAAVEAVRKYLSAQGIKLYDRSPLTDELNHIAEDPFHEERLKLLERIKSRVSSMKQTRFDGIEISPEEILREAMELIFQVR